MKKEFSSITVLVTACGVQFMPGLADCLKNNGERKIKLVGVDLHRDPTILQMVDVFYQVPKVDSPIYIPTILEICEKENVDILIPFMSSELPLFDKSREDFKKRGTIVSVASKNVLHIANNKLNLYDFMLAGGLPTPSYKKASNIEELKDALKYVGYPSSAACVKATMSSGSRGIRIIDETKSRFEIFMNEKPNSFYISYDEMIQLLTNIPFFPELMVMEYLPGAEYSVDVLADNGKVLYMCGRISNEINASIPQTATLHKDCKAYSICEKLVEMLRIDGNADFDFKFNALGEPVLMEINPRIAATMRIFKEGGLNLPYLRVKQLLGEALPAVSVRYGTRMKRRYLEMFAQLDV